jgi:glycosyltransferase involved in cell wall biosynthesis
VLAVGRVWDEAKSLATLGQASGALPWPVKIAGALVEPGAPEAPARPAAFAGTELLGCLSADEVARLYGRATIYALPARYEPFGLSVLEAALSGCALVLGDIPSLRELWEGAALFVSPDDPAALARRLTELIRAPDEQRRLAVEALARAGRYRYGEMIDRYLNLYAEALGPASSDGLSLAELEPLEPREPWEDDDACVS